MKADKARWRAAESLSQVDVCRRCILEQAMIALLSVVPLAATGSQTSMHFEAMVTPGERLQEKESLHEDSTTNCYTIHSGVSGSHR